MKKKGLKVDLIVLNFEKGCKEKRNEKKNQKKEKKGGGFTNWAHHHIISPIPFHCHLPHLVKKNHIIKAKAKITLC
jgi:hypothetical protein